MADRSWAQRNAAAVDTQPAATFEDLTDDVLIVVIDLLRVRVFFRTEGDETAGKSLFLEAVLVTNLVVQFGKALEGGSKVDDFHSFSVTAATISLIACSADSWGPRREPTTLWPPPPYFCSNSPTLTFDVGLKILYPTEIEVVLTLSVSFATLI